MVIISFRNGTDWYKANWVFRQLSEGVAELFPGDAEVNLAMERAQAFGALCLDKLEVELASRIVRAIGAAVEQTLEGKIQGWKTIVPGNMDLQRQYLESMTELLGLLRKQLVSGEGQS